MFLHFTLVLPYNKKPFSYGLNRALLLEALTDQVCMIVSIDWRSPAIVLLVLQANEVCPFASNQNKERQRPKASHNGVLIVEGEVEGNIDDWIPFVEPVILLWMLNSGSMNGLIYVTGFGKTDPNCTFGISRITNLKYLTLCESLLLGCSHAKLQYSYSSYLAIVCSR